MTTNLQPLIKSNLHRSLIPPQTPRLLTSLNSPSNLSHSVIHVNPNATIPTKNELKQNNMSYKYQRVGNMFKLIDIKSNNSDPQEQPIHLNPTPISTANPTLPGATMPNLNQDHRLDKLTNTVQDLTNRIISLQLQQAKIPGFERRINQNMNLCVNLESQCNYMGNKIQTVNKEFNQIKDRLEEIEEQGASFQRQVTDIFRLISQIKSQAVKTIPQINKKYQQMAQQLKTQIRKEIQHLQLPLRQHSLSQQKISPQSQYPSKPQSLLSSIFPLSSPTKPGPIQFKQKPLKLKYRETYQHQQSTYSINEVKYLIDREGRILDSSGFIILDQDNKEIRLNQRHLRKLAEYGLLN